MNTSPLDETIRTTISRRLILLCGEREITFAHAADQAGIEPSTLSRWCSPKHRTPPQLGPLIALADYFGVTLDWLSGRSDERNAGQGVDISKQAFQIGVAGSNPVPVNDAPWPEREVIAARAAAIRQAKTERRAERR